jgi:hypothetical protein
MRARNAAVRGSAGQRTGDSKTDTTARHSGTNGPLTLAQVARRHGVSRQILAHALLAGKGPRHQVVQGAVLVTVADADAWAAAFPLTAGRARHG